MLMSKVSGTGGMAQLEVLPCEQGAKLRSLELTYKPGPTTNICNHRPGNGGWVEMGTAHWSLNVRCKVTEEGIRC